MAMTGDGPNALATHLHKGPKDARYVENVIEHAFLSELLRHCWFVLGGHPVEVIRPDVDAGGYDLVLEAWKRPRYIQLKSRWQGASGPRVLNINSRLLLHPNPCIVWIFWEADTSTGEVTLQYKYWDPALLDVMDWPRPESGDPTFRLTPSHFVPDYLNIPDLVTRLFRVSHP